MQHVNDDMDELFRRAGEGYPLDTKGADWDRIARALGTPAPVETRTGRQNRRLLWLLLLLPFSLICTHYVSQKGKPDSLSGSAGLEGVQKSPAGFSAGSKEAGKGESHPALSQAVTAKGKGSGQGRQVALPAGPNEGAATSFFATGAKRKAVAGEETASGKQVFAKRYNRSPGLPEPGLQANPSPAERGGATRQRSLFFSTAPRPYPFAGIPPLAARHQDIVQAPSRIQTLSRHHKKFYLGAAGGVDATSVKFQKVENAGYDFGLLLGYEFSPKWHIESGLLADKKFYYSKGEYFKTNKVYLPPNSKITMVEGNCNMWEWPLNLYYHFAEKAKNRWFLAGGLSSYFMKKENYDYLYYYPQTGQSLYWNKSYTNASSHILSVAQFSAGYAHHLGKSTDIRIEPYLKFPLKGVGIGSLPLQSGGVHLVLTGKIF
ncbi:MAG: hypothetical protein ACXVBT_08920 [Flavisolibacter sp.]